MSKTQVTSVQCRLKFANVELCSRMWRYCHYCLNYIKILVGSSGTAGMSLWNFLPQSTTINAELYSGILKRIHDGLFRTYDKAYWQIIAWWHATTCCSPYVCITWTFHLFLHLENFWLVRICGVTKRQKTASLPKRLGGVCCQQSPTEAGSLVCRVP